MLLFACGTLKRGFPLHSPVLSDAAFLGEYQTGDRLPLVIAGPWFAPMMFHLPGEGFQVRGKLYKIKPSTLAEPDKLELVGKPGNLRYEIDVTSIDGGERARA